MPSIDMHVHPAPALDGVPETGPPALHRPDEAEAYLDRTGLDLAVVSAVLPATRDGGVGAWVERRPPARDGSVSLADPRFEPLWKALASRLLLLNPRRR